MNSSSILEPSIPSSQTEASSELQSPELLWNAQPRGRTTPSFWATGIETLWISSSYISERLVPCVVSLLCIAHTRNNLTAVLPSPHSQNKNNTNVYCLTVSLLSLSSPVGWRQDTEEAPSMRTVLHFHLLKSLKRSAQLPSSVTSSLFVTFCKN